MANTRSRASPQWRTLYKAAFLELDRDKLPQRITDAQQAIMDRMEDLNRSEDGPESEAALDALNALRGLRKVADGDGQSQK
jgi:hypothetical protein